MITNSSLTMYRCEVDNVTHLEKWTRYNYDNVWFFDKQSSVMNKGYENANTVEVRIPYNQNDGLDIDDFVVGNIIVQGTLNEEIETQQDLSNYKIYNVTSITNNNFGNNQHIHLGGK